MPPRGKKPGFKRGRHKLPYWIAHQVVRDHMGFPDSCAALPADASEDELEQLCQEYTARLYKWIAEVKAGTDPRAQRYDGTMNSACSVYETHPLSFFHTVKSNTRRTYSDSLKLIKRTVGQRLIRNLSVLDMQHWYNEWRKPATPGGPERIDRAHDAISMVKTVLRFCAAALRRSECKQLIDDLKHGGSLVRFEKGGARVQEMNYRSTKAFVRTALELGERGVIPADRALYMAISQAAMFELILRQKDIIGEWMKNAADLEKAKRHAGIGVVRDGEDTWVGFFTWPNIPGWRWRTKTSKSKYRQAAEFELNTYDILFPLLELVPHEQRHGAIVKGERGLPIQESSHRKWWRQIARAAKIPDEVQNMDSRAGGATEAEEAGVPLETISEALTHSDKRTTVRYIRRRTKKIADVNDARRRNRAADEGGK